jgi:hypothetical protein
MCVVQAGDIFRQGIALLLRRQAWSDAVSLLMRFGEACDKGGASSSQAKSYLGAIVVWLYAGNVQQAWQVTRHEICVGLQRRTKSGSAARGMQRG